MHPRPPARTLPRSCQECTVDRQCSFCGLPEHLRHALEAIQTRATHEKGESLFREGEACHGVVIMCEGTAKLITSSNEGKVLLLRFAGPGEILGAAEALRGGPWECSAIATEPCSTAVIPASTFLRFIRSYPEACLRLTTALSQQYKFTQQETRFLAFGDTSAARLAHLLLDWSKERGHAGGNGICIPAHLTHTELAQSIGSTRETVTRILGDLRHRGIVQRTPDAILIRNEHELTRLLTY